MFKMTKLYNTNLKLLSDDEFNASHKKVSRMTVRLFLAMLLFMICVSMIHNYLLPGIPDLIIDIVVFSSALPVFIFSIKWAIHDHEYQRRTRHLPPAFEQDQKTYDKIQKITKITGMVLTLGASVILIIEYFIYELGNISFVFAGCFMVVSFLLMHIYDLRKHIRKTYIKNHPEEK